MKSFRFCLLAAAAVALVACHSHEARAAGVSANVRAGVDGTYAGTNALGSVSFGFQPSSLIQFAAGTGAGKADLMFSDRRTLAASTSENLDLAGVLTDPLGAVLTFVKVKALFIKASCSNTNDVIVGGAAANPFLGPFGGTTPTVAIKPCGVFMVADPNLGWTVTPATGDLLKVLNGGAGTPVVYDIITIGASA